MQIWGQSIPLHLLHHIQVQAQHTDFTDSAVSWVTGCLKMQLHLLACQLCSAACALLDPRQNVHAAGKGHEGAGGERDCGRRLQLCLPHSCARRISRAQAAAPLGEVWAILHTVLLMLCNAFKLCLAASVPSPQAARGSEWLATVQALRISAATGRASVTA